MQAIYAFTISATTIDPYDEVRNALALMWNKVLSAP